MRLEYAGVPTEAELRHMDRLAARTVVPGGSPIHRLFLWIGCISALLGLASYLVPDGHPSSWFIVSIPCIVLWALLLRAQRRALAANTAQLQSGHVDTDGVTIRTAHSTSHIEWAAVTTAAVSPEAVVLFHGPATYYGFPRSAFRTEEDWATLSAFVASRFPSPAKQRALPTLSRGLPRWAVLAVLVLATLFFVVVVYFGAT